MESLETSFKLSFSPYWLYLPSICGTLTQGESSNYICGSFGGWSSLLVSYICFRNNVVHGIRSKLVFHHFTIGWKSSLPLVFTQRLRRNRTSEFKCLSALFLDKKRTSAIKDLSWIPSVLHSPSGNIERRWWKLHLRVRNAGFHLTWRCFSHIAVLSSLWKQ